MKTDHQSNKDKWISLIIPAYNEEGRIGDVITAAQSNGLINEVVVVNDGSTDQTSFVARKLGVKVIDVPINRGKGHAMQEGIDAVEPDILVFSDADILGIKKGHFEQLIRPLLDDDGLDMTVGKFSGGRFRTDLSHNLMPAISGQRALRFGLVEDLPNLSLTKFGAEIIITRHAKKVDANILEVVLNDLTHVMKEEKLGMMRGLSARLRMYQEMYRSIKPEKKV